MFSKKHNGRQDALPDVFGFDFAREHGVVGSLEKNRNDGPVRPLILPVDDLCKSVHMYACMCLCMCVNPVLSLCVVMPLCVEREKVDR